MLRYAIFIVAFGILSNATCRGEVTPSLHTNHENFKLAIDIGHTLKRGGAMSASGIMEYEFNKRLANELLRYLYKKNFKNSFIINPSGKEISLLQRVKIAKDKNATLFLSLHHDSVQPKYLTFYKKDGKKLHKSKHFSGYSIFFSKLNPHKKKSKTYAKFLGDELLKKGLKPTLHHAEKIKGENRELIDKKRGIYQFEDLIVLKRTSMPAVLLESGVIVNPDEERRLNTKKYREKIIQSIASALEKYSKKR